MSTERPPLAAEIDRLRKRVAELEGQNHLLRNALDGLETHSMPGPTEDWVMVPSSEWEAAGLSVPREAGKEKGNEGALQP